MKKKYERERGGGGDEGVRKKNVRGVNLSYARGGGGERKREGETGRMERSKVRTMLR